MSIFTIPASYDFILTLARGVLARSAQTAQALDSFEIILPSLRAASAFGEVLQDCAEQKTLILPKITTLLPEQEEEFAFGDSDLPPPIDPLRRLLMLRPLIEAFEKKRADAPPPMEQSLQLAEELARFQDACEYEHIADKAFVALSPPENYAEHWQQIIQFLAIIREKWPLILQSLNRSNPVAWRLSLLRRKSAAWREQPPSHTVIFAGSTGSVLASAELMQCVASLPKGEVILPGLDQVMTPECHQSVLETMEHPQHTMCRLLERFFALKPWQIEIWPECRHAAPVCPPERVQLLSLAQLPSPLFSPYASRRQTPLQNPADTLHLVECADDESEAITIALLLRETLETPNKTACLITANRKLSRRVVLIMKRWGIVIDDSAGTPLADSLPARLILLLAQARAAPESRENGIDIYAACAHPLAACGMKPSDFRRLAREKELLWRRSPFDRKPPSPWPDCVPKFIRTPKPVSGLQERLRALVEAAEYFCATDKREGSQNLWIGEAGRQLAEFLSRLIEQAAEIDCSGEEFPSLLRGLLNRERLRPHAGLHARLSIQGTIEARLQHADRAILGGLNEENWPPAMPTDPFLSRPMRKALGLMMPERRIGLAAHDFCMAASAEEVFLTRARMTHETQTQPSRFLVRLNMLLGAAPEDAPQAEWRNALETVGAGGSGAGALGKAKPPHFSPARPCPPISARPVVFSASALGRLIRDPYAYYARYILKLSPLPALSQPAGPAERGKIAHSLLQETVRVLQSLPQNPQDKSPEFSETEEPSALFALIEKNSISLVCPPPSNYCGALLFSARCGIF